MVFSLRFYYFYYQLVAQGDVTKLFLLSIVVETYYHTVCHLKTLFLYKYCVAHAEFCL